MDCRIIDPRPICLCSPFAPRRLGLKEFERKRIADAEKFMLEDPNFRTGPELEDIRLFTAAALAAAARGPAAETTYDADLARYYMWAQVSGQTRRALG